MIRAEAVNSWHNRCAVSVAVPSPVVASSSAIAVVGVGDPGSSRLVYAMVVGLAVIGVAFILLGVWVLRQTRPDLEVLAPLERMGDGDWKKRDPSTQRRMLDQVRPDGARPLVSEPLAPPLDDEFEQADHPVSSFSDLGPGLVAEQRDPTPMNLDLDPDLELPTVEHEPTDDDVETGSEPTDDETTDDETTDDDTTDDDTTDDDATDDDTTDDDATDDDATDDDAETGSDSDEALSDPRG